MKHLLVIVVVVFAVLIGVVSYQNYSKPAPQVLPPEKKLPATPPVVPPVPPTPVPPAPVPPSPSHSREWMRGYNDGYHGRWLAPAHWLLANEYRAGHSAGAADRRAGKSHRFDKL